ncbi:peptidase [Myxococcus sp. CA033]|uniref:peptidase n=1 Tax=Myxococcus sp. CA033 TaxID=2741516 RepID=UPI00157B5DAE|nr:peptidase [Myxococcus sp. CA033]NTX37536.1 peptidase [Myxococcus sp. CA033]
MKPCALLALWLWAGAAAAEVGAARPLALVEGEGAFAQSASEPGLTPGRRGLRRGNVHMELWASDIQLANLAVKVGGGPVYLTLLAGIEPGSRNEARFSFGLGVGGHVVMSHRFWLDLDVTGGAVQPVQKPLEGDGGNVLGQARVMLGVQVLPRLAVFVGPTYNLWFVWGQPDFASVTRMSVSQSQPKADQRIQHWPGLQLGLHF